MLFLPAFLCLVVSCFLFGEVSGDQVCVRGDIGSLFASSFLAVGTLGIFGGISWMLDAYGESNEELRRASATFVYISYCIVMSALLVYAEDFIKDIFDNKPPGYALGLLEVYGLSLVIAVVVARRRSGQGERGARRVQLTSTYFPAAFTIATIVTLTVINSQGPAAWRSLKDWRVYLALSVALIFPGVIVTSYASSLPDLRFKRVSTTTAIPRKTSD
jgi:hypothetical protein